jgi:hypothetical protein
MTKKQMVTMCHGATGHTLPGTQRSAATPTVAETVAAVNKLCEQLKDPTEGREVVRVRQFMTPDGKVETVKLVRVPDKGDATRAANEMPKREYAEPTSYFGVQDAEQIASADELQKLWAEARVLQSVLDDPATGAAERTRAEVRLAEVQRRVEALAAALKTTDRIGDAPTAGQARQFAVATPHFKLSDAKRAEYEAEVAALKAKIAAPGLRPEVKQKLEQDLAKVEHLLGMDRAPTPDPRTVAEKRMQQG